MGGHSGSRSRATSSSCFSRARLAHDRARGVPRAPAEIPQRTRRVPAGVGVNSVVPARGGDVVKMYLVKQRLPGRHLRDADADADRRDALRLLRLGRDPRLGALDRRAADAPGLLADPDRRLAVLPAPRASSPSSCSLRSLSRRSSGSCGRVASTTSSAIACARASRSSGSGRRLLLGVIVPQAISWVFRIAALFFFLRAFRVHANVHNALLAQVVESLATLFPATPGGAGTKQGLIVYLFRGKAFRARCCWRSASG